MFCSQWEFISAQTIFSKYYLPSFLETPSTSWRRSITGNSPINFQRWWRPKEWLQLSGFFEIYSNYFIVCILFIFRKCVSKVLAERSGNSSLGTLVNKILVRSDVRPKLEKLEVSLHSSETLEVINSFRTPLFIPISQMEQVGFLIRLTSKHWFQVQIDDESDGEGGKEEGPSFEDEGGEREMTSCEYIEF